MLKIDIEEKKFDTVLFEDFHLQFASFGLYAITGNSGTGKSTLLNMIAMLDESYTGKIEIDGKMLDHEMVKHSIGYCIATNCLMNDLTVKDYIALYEKMNQRKIDATLLDFDLKIEVGKLSRGQMQRLSLLCVLSASPPILLLDEITSGLDQENKIKVMELIRAYSDNHLVIMVDHDVEFLDQYCKKVIELKSHTSYIEEGGIVYVQIQKHFDPLKKQMKKYKRSHLFFLNLSVCIVLVSSLLFYFSIAAFKEAAIQQVKNLFPEDTYSFHLEHMTPENLEIFEDQYVYLVMEDIELAGIKVEGGIYEVDDYSMNIRELKEGNYPQNDSEIVIGSIVADRLSLRVGGELTLEYHDHEQNYQFVYMISGISTGNEVYFHQYGEYHRFLEIRDIDCNYAIISVNNEEKMVEQLKQTNLEYKRVGESFVSQVSLYIDKIEKIIQIGTMVIMVISSLILIEVIFYSVKKRRKLIGFLYLQGLDHLAVFRLFYGMMIKGILILSFLCHEVISTILLIGNLFDLQLLQYVNIQYISLYLLIDGSVGLILLIALRIEMKKSPLEILKGR